MTRLLLLLVVLLLFGFACNGSKKAPPTGTVVAVIDGDTYDVVLNGVQTRVRIHGIDAPERGMPFYKASKEYLKDLIIGKVLRVEPTDTDRYGRMVANAFLEDGRNVGELMIRNGFAWHYTKYNQDKAFALAQEYAMQYHLGLWQDKNPTPPWEYRKEKRKNKKI